MPRPIPDDVENVTGFIWYLIPVPDDPVFVQAAWDAFSELTYPWNWGKEGRVPESDIAAQLWSDAIYEALRVRDMGFPDLLLDYLDEVEPLLRQIAESDFCCDSLPGADTIYTDLPSGLETSDTDTDTSTFPDGIADGNEWDDYICRAATAFVDSFIEIPDQITGAISATIQVLTLIVIVFTTGAYIGIAGAIGGVLTIAGILEALGYLEEIIDGLTAGTEDTPSAVQTELLAVRDDLICDIVLAPTASAAGTAFRTTMAGAVTSTAWENLLLLLSADAWFAKIYNHDAETAPAATCNCVETYDLDLLWTFDANADNWSNDGNAFYDETTDDLSVAYSGGVDGRWGIGQGRILQAASLSGPVTYQPEVLEFDVWYLEAIAGRFVDLQVRVHGTVVQTIDVSTISQNSASPTHVVIDVSSVASEEYFSQADLDAGIQFRSLQPTNPCGDCRVHIDNVRYKANEA